MRIATLIASRKIYMILQAIIIIIIGLESIGNVALATFQTTQDPILSKI
jgi:hypothetical protein